MREANALDFDGLEAELAQLLTRHPNVAAELRRRVPHVLVDEYQDTSAGQQALLATLAPPHLFRVGDHAQSIYGFRGAHVQGFQDAAAASAVYDLSTNYRSLAEIVLSARQVGDRMIVPGLPQVSGRGPGPDSAAEIAAADREALLSPLVDDLHQAKAVLDCDWKDLAVLAPRWFSLQALAQLLEGEGIPHRLAKRSTDLLDGAVARWVVHLLRVASNPHDHLSLYAALTAWTPLVTTGSWAKIRRVAMDRGGNVLDVAIAEGLPIVHALAGRSLTEADEFLRVIRDDLAEQLDRLHLAGRVEELDRVIARVVKWAFEEVEGDDSDSVSAFLDWYSGRHLDGEREVESVPDAVVLSSVHGAKGLEWRAVWVLGVEEEGAGAWVKPGATPEQEDEARRLLYVAMTRARDRLRVCWPEHRGRTRLLAGVELPVRVPRVREQLAPPAGVSLDVLF
jgi:superfamily I DNA/RNA helicase